VMFSSSRPIYMEQEPQLGRCYSDGLELNCRYTIWDGY
jgi:hypothetical protein